MKKKICLNQKEKNPLHRLPFIGREKGAPMISFWNVPAKGGYGGGNTTGHALALIYLRHLKEHGVNPGGSLGSIARDMTGLGNTIDYADLSREENSRQGQIISFFNTIEQVIGELLKSSNLNIRSSNEELIAKANSGLSGHW
ncbi:hypothetical protein JNO12_19130 [Erwinia aphidicola]|nr:hypothetical protein [Erwinia aphidicola]